MGRFYRYLAPICMFFLLVPVIAMGAGESELSIKSKTFDKLQADFPGVKIYRYGPEISRIYGIPLGTGDSPEAVAERFKDDYSMVFGVNPSDLKPVSTLYDDRHTQPVMYDQKTGAYKFTLVYYSQYKNDIPVYGSDLRFLVRNEPGYPLVLAASSLKDLGDYTMPEGIALDRALAETAVRTYADELVNFSEGRLVIWAGIDDMEVEPALAIEMVADNGLYATPDYNKRIFLIDAINGEILYSENMILETDVVGTVSGMATSGNGADICGPEPQTPMPYARVYIGSIVVYTDETGNFIIPNGGSSPVTVTSNIRGLWFRVYNQNGPDAEITLSVTPPGPADFIHNQSNTSEYNRAEVNGYIQANIIRDFTLTYNPSYPQLSQIEFPVNVNLNDNCNAYYDYNSINFFTSGDGCANTAFSTVVHHEYGHHLVYTGGSGQGQYGEGMGDVMGMLITDDPGLAYGFYGNCLVYMRTGDNTMQYPCSGEIHYCGQLLSGCVWSIRNELIVNYPGTYIDIIGSLAVNAILLHSGNEITPTITIDYLTLDDDDGYIGNGTPHYPELCAGFNAHNMDCPELDLVMFYYPDGKPAFIYPSGNTVMTVEVQPVSGTPLPNTGYFYYDTGGGYVSVQMTMISPNVYQAVFPAVTCGTSVSYYLSAQASGGMTVYDPPNAPASAFGAMAAYDLLLAFDDNFETHQGWTVVNSVDLTDGAWERGIPVGGGDRGDPPTDYDGSGQCYVTDNVDGNSDVDGGYTYLISPAFDLSGGDGIIEYALWYTNNEGSDPNNDLFKVWVSSNNGTNWTHVETFGPVTSAGWTVHSFVAGDYVTPTSQVKVRFEASDLGLGSIVEAGIDAVSVVIPDCEGPPGCEYTVGDVNGSEDYNGLDVTYSVNFLKGGPAPVYECECVPGDTWYVAGDVNNSCSFNGLDV
ncbi:MAG: choice-of-anchor J domain-containing protein, partial [Candidatus Zixiibacteriota bacterium]